MSSLYRAYDLHEGSLFFPIHFIDYNKKTNNQKSHQGRELTETCILMVKFHFSMPRRFTYVKIQVHEMGPQFQEI